ncbi:uncharacterized protein LOC134225618 [Armigeres subalbatus]|uniref:uncharacterized protein LOC134225618 n=1 Tax=Armigeres subalbatus TaxID=124917 RepID=UPI002ED0EFC5
MTHFHLQLFANRIKEVSRIYLQQVKWINAGVLPEIGKLLQVIDSTCSKQRIMSQRTYVFDNVESGRDIFQFYRSVQCCGKTLWNSDTLIMHIQQHDGLRDELDNNDTKRLAILFNLYVQVGMKILEIYNNNYENIEQFTANLLLKAAEYLDSIQSKSVRSDHFAADTFTEDVTFAKWKYVFDYTCATCTDSGIHNCRYEGAIAWFLIHLNTMSINAIRHLGSKMHASRIGFCLPDRDIPPSQTLVPRQKEPAIYQLSKAAKYLQEVRETELEILCTLGMEVLNNTPYEAVTTYLKANLGPLIPKMTIEHFGSRVIGIGNHESDLDLFIKSEINMKPKNAYNKVLAWAKANQNSVDVEKQIPEGPKVLRLFVHTLKLRLDVTFDSPYVVGNGKIINYFFRLQPMGRKLFYLLKQWKMYVGISDKFHNNVLTSLIIFYMQSEQYLPPIAPLVIGPKKINNLYNTNFEERITLYSLPINFLTLVQEFFNYWALFDWTRNGASLSEARVRPKHVINARKTNPPMLITDCFDVTRNVAGNVNSEDYQKFVQACKEASDVLKTKLTI